jgi:hypothetical protein
VVARLDTFSLGDLSQCFNVSTFSSTISLGDFEFNEGRLDLGDFEGSLQEQGGENQQKKQFKAPTLYISSEYAKQ